MFATLKTVCAFAICRGVSAASRSAPLSVGYEGENQVTNSASCPMKLNHSTTPATLKTTWTAAARTASRGLRIDASMAVTHVPMFAPKMSAMPASSEMNP